jgi:ribosomal protein S5
MRLGRTPVGRAESEDVAQAISRSMKGDNMKMLDVRKKKGSEIIAMDYQLYFMGGICDRLRGST